MAITGTSSREQRRQHALLMSADLLGDYLKNIGQVSLLSADDEISLGHRVQAMLRIREDRPEQD